ncbi:MAG: hypothetical protein ACE5K2_06875, partial [Candidatus Zixiibacteriota bacterium]
MPLVEHNPIVYEIVVHGAKSYILENRQYVGFDQHIPGGPEGVGGLLIWYVVCGSVEQLRQADADGYQDEEDYFGPTNHEFSPLTYPCSNLPNNEASGV